jgi:hypothetical protein
MALLILHLEPINTTETDPATAVGIVGEGSSANPSILGPNHFLRLCSVL